jgi:hypothetical protein
VIGLAEMGCDYTQGFLFSEPLTASSMAAMLDDLAERELARRPIDVVIAVDAAPTPVVIHDAGANDAPPHVTQPPRRMLRAESPTAAPPIPQSRRRTGHDEDLARLLRPLIHDADVESRRQTNGADAESDGPEPTGESLLPGVDETSRRDSDERAAEPSEQIHDHVGRR